jgi:RHS repeat-associated protein
VKTYTYDSANRLVQVSDQSTVTSLSYNGLGQRLSMDAAGVIAHYVLDGDRLLVSESGGNETTFLYGLGPIGEKTNVWNFALPDGSNTPRQLTDTQGAVTLSTRYTPWGDTLEIYGTGNFTFGYLGGVLDAATGLLYVGNGQYYDPSTGRFLTRDVYPNSPNPYVPWNPIGAILAPLAVLSLVYGRKKKHGKWDTLLIIVLLGVSAGVGLVACAPPPSAPGPIATAVPSNTPAPSNPSPVQAPVSTGPATVIAILPIATASPTVTLTLPDFPTA